MSDRGADVLFVVIDSARKDRLSTYGHDRETTPALDRLAERATVYENAYAPAPWTLPTHGSLFTGLHPSEHGMTNGFADRTPRMPGDVSTLAERLSERGYRTAGFSNNPWVGGLTGLDRGFDEFVEWDLQIGRSSDPSLHGTRGRLYSRAHTLLGHANRQPLVLLKRRFFTSALVDRARTWLGRTGADRPAFTFLNLMEAHSPYYPPDWAFDRLGLEPPGPLEARLLNTRLLAYVMGKTALTDRQRVMEFYDASLRYQDAKVDELLGALAADGRLDETLVIVCADHGKTLGEFDRDAEPPHYLYDINVNVPLLVKWPGQTESRRVEAPFELTRLFDAALGERPDPTDAALVEDFLPHTGRSADEVTRWRALADGEGTYVRSEDGSEHRLVGEAERQSVADDPESIRTARDALDGRVETLSSPDRDVEFDDDLDAEVEAQLADLGYLE